VVTTVVAVAALVVAVCLPLLVVKAARTIANSKEGRAVTVPGGDPVALLPDSRGGLLLPLDRAGVPAGFVVMAVTPDKPGGTIILIPATTHAPVTGLADPARLRDAHEVGGLAAATEATSGYLAVTLSASEERAADSLAQLLAPYGPFSVTLDENVVDTATGGTELLLAQAGKTTVTADQMARLLVARRASESEYARLPRIATLWHAIANAVTSAPAATTASGPQTGSAPALNDIPSFLARMAGGPVNVQELQVRPLLDQASNPDGIDLVEGDVLHARLLMATYLPGALATVAPGLRVRIVDPIGDPHLLDLAVIRLTFAGANVILLGTGTSVPQTTTIEYDQDTNEQLAKAYGPLFGGADVSKGGTRIDGIDATVTLGRSYAESVAAEEAAAATSSTTIPSTTIAATTTSGRGSTTTKPKKGNG